MRPLLTRYCLDQYSSNARFHLSGDFLPTSGKTKEVLIAIGKERKATGVASGKFIKKYKLSTPSSVQAALKGLQEKNLVSQEQNQYEISDKLLGVWLQKNY